MVHANRTNPDQTVPEGESDLAVHSLPFHQIFSETDAQITNLGEK